jgi:hypothetical protein
MRTNLFCLISLVALAACSNKSSNFQGVSEAPVTQTGANSEPKAVVVPDSKGATLKITSTAPTSHNLENNLETAKPLDLSLFKAYDFTTGPEFMGAQGSPATWVISDDKTTVTQNTNARPTIFYQDLALEDYAVNGKWLTSSNTDDDYMGFVFALQDPGHFYLFS